ncbi:MAG: type 2 lantibiotic [Clostridiales bacterium]|uniref:lichenicidin A2 family type 2 lantibiotic n=1 Tax=Roseburia sp. MSJ-14 TaxID=2841514 RepID=UPI0016B06BBC|nr:lichenicidin A2 family type 2 lantibiotic [Roseburia sp. MSJ-14]MBU5474180.1 lichenicidin A2 family type 2 lantibiotic [Roseburia sp. MSJ-14]NLK77289.1 type 2 lantibiotic [Clostridiales bacterium]
MSSKNVNNLVGKSFEELSVEEMMEMQGAANADANSTVVIPISTIEISEAVSVLVSALSASTISVVASKKNKCK